MPRFVFQLDPVLDYRQRLEDEQQIALAAAVSAQRSAEAQRDDYVARRNQMRDRLVAHHRDMNSIELRATYAHCDFLDRAIVDQQRVVDKMRKKTDEERAKLILKTKDKKILATLKERRREQFDTDAAVRDQQESDEINSRHFDRITTAWESSS
jgi:flagellar FliJ protein